MILIDTCILINHFRGDTPTTRFLLENNREMKICSVTDMEISQGVRNKAELRCYEKLLQELGIQIIDLNEEISVKARLWVRSFGLSHGLYLADALIAATASRSWVSIDQCQFERLSFFRYSACFNKALKKWAVYSVYNKISPLFNSMESPLQR